MKSTALFVIGMAGIAFAQDALHEAIDNGDYATAKAMVKNGEVQEIYYGKCRRKPAADVYAPFYKAAQQQFFESCPVQFSAAYANKVCADAKKMQLCAMTLDTLQVAALSGNPAALPAFEAAAKVAVKNKAYTKPVPVKVDTVLWKVCSKKESQDCLASCNAWADSALASAGDSSVKAAVESQSLLCSQKPQKRVNTTATVNMPSSSSRIWIPSRSPVIGRAPSRNLRRGSRSSDLCTRLKRCRIALSRRPLTFRSVPGITLRRISRSPAANSSASARISAML